MNKLELKNKLQDAALSNNEAEKLEELAGRVDMILENCPVFSKVAISVERFKLMDGSEEKIVVTIKERLTNKKFKLSLCSVMTMPKELKTKINVNGVLNAADLVSIQNVAELLAELSSDATLVDEFPVLDEEVSSSSYKALYSSLIEDIASSDISITTDPEEFTDKNCDFCGLLCNEFRQAGRNVVLMSAEDLMQALDITDVTEFKSVMRCWRKENMLYVNEAAKKAGRMQVKHRISGTNKYSWYAVVIPQDIKMGTVVTVNTTDK